MITPEEIGIIKQTVEEFLSAMSVEGFAVHTHVAAPEEFAVNENNNNKPTEGVDVDITLTEPQFLIGENGKTLIDLQRVVRMVLYKKIGKVFGVRLDINNYRAQKMSQLKKTATEAADQVAASGSPKTLPPMSSYERRIIHAQLAGRADVATQSQGEGSERCVVIVKK